MYIGLQAALDGFGFPSSCSCLAAFRSVSEARYALSVEYDLHPQIGNPEGKVTHSLRPEESERVAELVANIYETHQASPI